MRAFAHQQLEQFVLRGVGVLVLVDQHMAQQALPFLAHLGMAAQQAHGHADQVVEVHALVGGQALLVALHDQGDAALVVVLGHGQGLAAVPAGVFPVADGPLPLACGGRVGGAAGAVLEDAGHIVGIQNAEVGLEPQRMAVLTHHAHPQRVEGADHHVLGGLADQALGPLAHFGGGLVGEGDGGDALGRHAVVDQPADLVRDHACLARARARQHQAGAFGVMDSLELGEVQTSRHGTGRGSKDGQTTNAWQAGVPHHTQAHPVPRGALALPAWAKSLQTATLVACA